MFHRLKQIYVPSKGWAAFGTFAFLACTIWALVAGGMAALMWAPAMFLFTLWYGGVWLYRRGRDRKIATKAQSMQKRPLATSAQRRTSPDSYRLTVPPQRAKRDM